MSFKGENALKFKEKHDCGRSHAPGLVCENSPMKILRFPSFRNGYTTVITAEDELPDRSKINKDYTVNKAKIIGKGA